MENGEAPMALDEFIENHPFNEIRIGDSASITRTLSRDDSALFAAVSGDVNPTHFGSLGPPTVHSMWGGMLASAVLGSKLPGPGTAYVAQSLRFGRSLGVGDSITIKVTVTEKRPSTGTVILHRSAVKPASSPASSE